MTDLALRDNWNSALANVCADLSKTSAAQYTQRLDAFRAYMNGRTLDKAALGAYKRHLLDQGKSPSTVNGYLSAIKRMIGELADVGALDPRIAVYIQGVKGAKQRGDTLGNWLTKKQANALLKAPDTTQLKGLRDKAILAVLVWCGLRRSELAGLTLGHIQEREGHTVFADIRGKHGRIRTVKVPVPVLRVIREFLEARAELPPDAPLFVPVLKGGRLNGGKPISPQAIYDLVKQYGEAIGVPELRAHDLRRTFAKLANKGGAPLEAISQDLGHASLETTQRYLGLELDLDSTAGDFIRLKV